MNLKKWFGGSPDSRIIASGKNYLIRYKQNRYDALVQKLELTGLIDSSYHPDTVEEVLLSLIDSNMEVFVLQKESQRVPEDLVWFNRDRHTPFILENTRTVHKPTTIVVTYEDGRPSTYEYAYKMEAYDGRFYWKLDSVTTHKIMVECVREAHDREDVQKRKLRKEGCMK
jgi:hypothetical protein